MALMRTSTPPQIEFRFGWLYEQSLPGPVSNISAHWDLVSDYDKSLLEWNAFRRVMWNERRTAVCAEPFCTRRVIITYLEPKCYEHDGLSFGIGL